MNKAPIESNIINKFTCTRNKRINLIELMQIDNILKKTNSISSIKMGDSKVFIGSGHDLSQTNYKNKRLEIFVLNDADLTDKENTNM